MNQRDKIIEFILKNDSLEELKELKSSGFLVADSIYGKGEKNFRLYGIPPFEDAEENGLILSLGPFPVEIKQYDHLINLHKRLEIDKEIHLAIFLASIKIQYEIYGNCEIAENPKISQPLLEEMISFLIGFYNLTNPIKTANFYWIMPKEDAAQIFYLINNIPKEKQIENWWNIRMQLRPKSKEKEYHIKTSNHFLVLIVLNEWAEYLPDRILVPLFIIFSIGNKNGRFIRMKEKEFKEKLFNCINKNRRIDIICTDPDKEILCKKLIEENNINYPVFNEEMFDFFMELNFIKRKFIKGEKYIYINKNIKDPIKVLKITDNFKSLNEQYQSSGSIVLNYVSLEEYIKLTTKK